MNSEHVAVVWDDGFTAGLSMAECPCGWSTMGRRKWVSEDAIGHAGECVHYLQADGSGCCSAVSEPNWLLRRSAGSPLNAPFGSVATPEEIE